MRRQPPRYTLFPYTTLFRSNRKKKSSEFEQQNFVTTKVKTSIRRRTRCELLVDRYDQVPQGLETVAGHSNICPSVNYLDRKSTRLNSSHANISYAVFCLKKK